MPPEMVGNKPYGTNADIYSLGCLMHMLLLGELPFYDGYNKKKYHLRLQFEPLDLEKSSRARRLSPLAKSLLFAMLDKDPVKRFSAE
mmetsp:Transcript_11244/g.15164  ORF Transcript_11244/g.15164 Transcript_11244/m.15164 type:complete len:87 (-) Transcript_11244:110-370(-)